MDTFSLIIFGITKGQTLLPILFAATDHDVHKKAIHFNLQNLLNIARVFGVSFFFTLLAIKIFIRLLPKIILLPFKMYRPAFVLSLLYQPYHRPTGY